MYRRTTYNVRSPESRRRIALQCVDLLLPRVTLARRKKVADHILALCQKGQPKEISEDRLLDVAYKILQVNRAYLCRGRKGKHREHKDHRAYFRRHLKILRALIAEAQQ
jgi:hypothetical protein